MCVWRKGKENKRGGSRHGEGAIKICEGQRWGATNMCLRKNEIKRIKEKKEYGWRRKRLCGVYTGIV